MEFSSKLSAICTKWCAQSFPPIFGVFAIFDCNFSKIVAPTNDGNENCVVHLKELSLLKQPCKRQRNAYSNCVPPLTNSSPASERYKEKTPYFRTYSRRALYDLFQTLHGDRACRAHQKKCHPFFDPTYRFSYRVHGKIWPNLPTRGFSTITA